MANGTTTLRDTLKDRDFQSFISQQKVESQDTANHPSRDFCHEASTQLASVIEGLNDKKEETATDLGTPSDRSLALVHCSSSSALITDIIGKKSDASSAEFQTRLKKSLETEFARTILTTLVPVTPPDDPRLTKSHVGSLVEKLQNVLPAQDLENSAVDVIQATFPYVLMKVAVTEWGKNTMAARQANAIWSAAVELSRRRLGISPSQTTGGAGSNDVSTLSEGLEKINLKE